MHDASNLVTSKLRADIQGLRAIAILAVIAAHAGIEGFYGGFIGVDIFFVISGFIITKLICNEIEQVGKFSFVNFYAKRIKRLFPALITMIVISSIVAANVLPYYYQPSNAEGALSAAVWLSNFYFAFREVNYFENDALGHIFLHTWSLSVEEQFYLLWPAIVAAAYYFRKTSKTSSLNSALIATGIVSFFSFLWFNNTNPSAAYYMTPLRVWQFSMGALVFIHTRDKKICRNTSLLFFTLGLTLIALTALLITESSKHAPVWLMIVTIGSASVLIAGSCNERTGSTSLLCLPLLQKIGNISYSLYLWHWPVLILGGYILSTMQIDSKAVLITITFMISVLSYVLIEQPLRRINLENTKDRFFILFATASSFCIATLLAFNWRNSAITNIAILTAESQNKYYFARTDLPKLYSMGCDDWYHSDQVKVCEAGNKNSNKIAVLFSDSVGAQWFPALNQIFTAPEWRFLVVTKSSCTIAEASYIYARIGREYIECTQWKKNVLSLLTDLRPHTVIIGSAENTAIDPESWINGTKKILEKISIVSKNIYVLKANASLPVDGPGCLISNSNNKKPSKCVYDLSELRTANSWPNIEKAAKNFENVKLLDIDTIVCPDGLCSAERDDTVVYRDSMHLTASFIAAQSERVRVLMGL